MKYYDNWSHREDIALEYKGVDIPKDEEIVYAGYTYEDYEGSAIVVFVKDGVLYENNDSHCSCNGLENWGPEETSAGALFMRTGWPGLHEALTAAGYQPPTPEPVVNG